MRLDDAKTVRSEQREPGLAADRDELLLPRRALGVALDESAGPSDARSDPGGGALAHGPGDRGGRNGQDRKIRR